MAIKNKDGSVYKLNGPNPVMKEQSVWKDFTIHNMNFGKEIGLVEVSLNPAQPIPVPQPQSLDFIKELEKKEPEIAKTPEPVVEKGPPKEIVSVNLPPGVEKIDVYCLPSVIRERRDNLYGDKYQTTSYGNPFLFEAIIYKEEDLFVQIWTNVTQPIGRGSVLYPKKGTKRWWKVTEKEEKSNGWLLTGIPSEYTPAFNLQAQS